MSSLLAITTEGSESAHAPEFRYLASHVLLQARQVFDQVTVAAPGVPEDTRRFDAVLLLGSSHVLIGRQSLAALRDRLSSGWCEARPHRLADVGTRVPIYTLRGYERAEADFLGREVPGAIPPATSSRLPVSLLTPDRFEHLRAEISLDRLLSDPQAGAGVAGEVGAAGLYHEFIDYYGEVRSDVLPFLPSGAREVLEVGCGRGATGKLIQERLGCRVTGVELNPVVAREAARHLHRVLQGDVQALAIEGRFDAVLALELVEHLVETESFLARVRQLLAPGGRAIFSIPNVGHYAVVEDLIAGRWDYLPVGLLCYTHFRFFTRHTLADWLRRSGLERFELVSQRTELPEHPERFTSHFETDLESLSTKGFYVLVEG
ncbi:MAG TPA: class I SAM-dependent methyltransferase [Thermoanaerobaculia bacterium]|nr:class I SAM-dependent methyltransferase [Thermoanaerobaculia bacterium]